VSVVTVTVGDARLAGFCWAGIRLFAKRHGLDWDTFLNHGVPSEGLPDDAMCSKVVAIAVKRARHEEIMSGDSN
jgi:hypothetical protein